MAFVLAAAGIVGLVVSVILVAASPLLAGVGLPAATGSLLLLGAAWVVHRQRDY